MKFLVVTLVVTLFCNSQAQAQWLRGSPYGWPHYGVYQQWCCWSGFNSGPRYYNPEAIALGPADVAAVSTNCRSNAFLDRMPFWLSCPFLGMIIAEYVAASIRSSGCDQTMLV
jgi:hypothetical protein